jgi:hypothetical protein
MQLSSECSAPKHAGDSVNVDPVGHQVEKDVHRDDAQQSKGVDSAEVHLTVLQPAARPLAQRALSQEMCAGRTRPTNNSAPPRATQNTRGPAISVSSKISESIWSPRPLYTLVRMISVFFRTCEKLIPSSAPAHIGQLPLDHRRNRLFSLPHTHPAAAEARSRSRRRLCCWAAAGLRAAGDRLLSIATPLEGWLAEPTTRPVRCRCLPKRRRPGTIHRCRRRCRTSCRRPPRCYRALMPFV